uniref:Ig-like domain-containing protein n=1 Tax=Fundulus heteroclitus TaxID=8078 RepID=A0A3Q2PYH1_FUNHE
MTLICVLIWTLLCFSQGQVTITQTPGSQSVVPGQTVSIKCKVNPSTSYCFNWYLQKPGESPKLIVRCTNTRQSRVPDRFSGTNPENTDFTLTISGVEAEDVGVYYCQNSQRINSQDLFTQ